MTYDILILAAKKDFINLTYLYNSITAHLYNYNKIYCICPELPQFLLPGVEYRLERQVLDINVSEIKYRSTWVYQQYLKLLQNITVDKYLVIDADLVINKDLEIFTNERPNFLLSNKTINKPFFEYSKKLFNIDVCYNYSFVSEIMLFDRELIDKLLRSKFKTNNDFIVNSNNIITTTCFPSEYELYGSYVRSNYRTLYGYKPIETINALTFKEFDITNINSYKDSKFDIIYNI